MWQIKTVTSLVHLLKSCPHLCNKLYYLMIKLYTKLTIHYHLRVILHLYYRKKQPRIILLISHVWCDLALLKPWQYAENDMMWWLDFEPSILLPSYGDYLLTLPLNQGMDAAALLRSWEKKKKKAHTRLKKSSGNLKCEHLQIFFTDVDKLLCPHTSQSA